MRNIKLRHIFLLAMALCLPLFATLTNTYDISTPGATDDPRQADDEMRLTKAATQERMNDHNGTADEGDHYWPLTVNAVSDVDTGQHRMVTLRELATNPLLLTSYASPYDPDGVGFVFLKDIGGNGELFWEDEAANVLQLTDNGLFNLNSAYWHGTFATKTADAGDSEGIALASGGAYGVGRGAGIKLYGNEHATNPGQLVLEAGYSTGTTKAIIDAKTSKISNVADPAAAQDAVTKAYLETIVGTGAMSPIPYAGGQTVKLPNGLTIKFGVTSSILANGTETITYGTAFDTGIIAVFASPAKGSDAGNDYAVGAIPKAGETLTKIEIGNYLTATAVYWFAIGY